jgi:hypothetical protein
VEELMISSTPKQQENQPSKKKSPEPSYSSLAYEERKRQQFIQQPEPSHSPISTNNTRYNRASNAFIQ